MFYTEVVHIDSGARERLLAAALYDVYDLQFRGRRPVGELDLRLRHRCFSHELILSDFAVPVPPSSLRGNRQDIPGGAAPPVSRQVRYPGTVRFAHLIPAPTSAPELVVVHDERYVAARALGANYATLQQLIEAGGEAVDQLRAAAAAAPADAWQDLANVSYGPAILGAPIVLAVGLNYDEHASELSLDNDSGPVLFSLFPNSLGAHNGEVPIPVHISEEVDYEGELGVVIGRAAKNVTADEALDYVFGYTVINDITARNVQFQEPQWSRCKSFDGFTPVGPVVVTADEIPDPQALAITTDVDGLRVQDSTTGFMVRTVAELIASISQSLTLLPGTVISTGSPGGAGRSRKPPLYLVPGTEVTVSIENVGVLTSHCTRA